jgi:DNA-binding transcriptional ArsR family regulator
MFSSLRHPARRKILRMLSERTMTFSQMLEALAIPSSHLTYHLENLGELVLKDKVGKYGLSSFGKASVSMMKGAEEVPDIHVNRFSALSIRWKSLYAIFIIVVVFLAGFTYLQYTSLNSLTNDYGNLKADYENVKTQNQHLLAWSPSTNQAMTIFNQVIQIDVSKYQANLESNTAEVRSDLGGVIEEVFKYSLQNSQSNFELTLRFRNSHFSMFQLNQLEGYPNYPPIYTQPQPTDALQASVALIQRYKSVTNDTYLDEAANLLASASNSSGDQTLGNTKLKLSAFGADAEARLMYTANGTDFEAKSIYITFKNHIVQLFSDDWFLFKVGNTQVNVSEDQAVLAAKNAAKNFSWSVNGTKVTNFKVVDNPVSVMFYPFSRSDPLTLYPYWYVILYLDKTYPDGVKDITVGVWADTGNVESIKTG